MPESVRVFFAALTFYTRIPSGVRFDADHQKRSIVFFPLIGWLIGGFSALIYWLCLFVFPQSVAIIAGLVAAVFFTGGLHEDGFADVCDGFGAGWNRERILRIMKDSSIGTYAAIGLIFLIGTKLAALSKIPSGWIPAAFICGHALSRWLAASIMATHDYARVGENSKAEGMVSRMRFSVLAISGVFGLLPLALFWNPRILSACLPLFLARWLLGVWYRRKIDGYTGDCLGAAQQILEVLFYLSLLGVDKFIPLFRNSVLPA